MRVPLYRRAESSPLNAVPPSYAFSIPFIDVYDCLDTMTLVNSAHKVIDRGVFPLLVLAAVERVGGDEMGVGVYSGYACRVWTSRMVGEEEMLFCGNGGLLVILSHFLGSLGTRYRTVWTRESCKGCGRKTSDSKLAGPVPKELQPQAHWG